MKNSQNSNEKRITGLRGPGAEEKRLLIELIKKHLRKGDVADVARKNGFSLINVQSVMRYRTFIPEYVNALYERAMENKKKFNVSPEKMISNLNK